MDDQTLTERLRGVIGQLTDICASMNEESWSDDLEVIKMCVEDLWEINGTLEEIRERLG